MAIVEVNPGYALKFNRSQLHRVEVPDSTSLDSIITEITLEARIKMNSYVIGEKHMIMSKCDKAVPDGWEFYIERVTSITAWVYLMIDGNIAVKGRIPSNITMVGEWHHLLIKYEDIFWRGEFSLDGIDFTEEFLLSPLSANNHKFMVGGVDNYTGSDYWFDGVIDEARVYNRKISGVEAIEHYEGTFTDESGLVSYYPFNEGEGILTADKSGNNNDGTLIGSVMYPSWYHGFSFGYNGVNEASIRGQINRPTKCILRINNKNGKRTNTIMPGDFISINYHQDAETNHPEIFYGKVYMQPDYTSDVVNAEALSLLTEFNLPIVNFNVKPGMKIFDILVSLIGHLKDQYDISYDVLIDGSLNKDLLLASEPDYTNASALRVIKELIDMFEENVVFYADRKIYLQKLESTYYMAEIDDKQILGLRRDYLSRQIGAIVVTSGNYNAQFPKTRRPGSIISTDYVGFQSNNDCYILARRLYEDITAGIVNNVVVDIRDKTFKWICGAEVELVSKKYGINDIFIITAYETVIGTGNIKTTLHLSNSKISLDDVLG